MRVLVTGHRGYIGAVLTPLLVRAGHVVVGLDSDLYRGCDLGPAVPPGIPEIEKDIRDVRVSDFHGGEAVVHLAALSNDPLGDIDPEVTFDINLRASIGLAEAASAAGVSRFVFSSSCSVYGAAGDDFLDEQAAFNPVTPYGESKVLVEAALGERARPGFSPVYLRNATAYGHSPRLRLDLVVNDLVANAVTSGRVEIKSDGTPWRPLVHVEDIARAVLASIEASPEAIHNQAFNIGRTVENYRVTDLAAMVAEAVPGSEVVYAPGGGPDRRCYRVDFTKAAERLPGFTPRWTVREGIRQLVDAFQSMGLHREDLTSDRFVRLRRIRTLLDREELRPDLRREAALATVGAGGR